METPNDLQKQILKIFYDLQCNEDSGFFNDDETPLVSYRWLEKETGKTHAELKPDMLLMRNERIIELTQAMNMDYMYSGRGWVLTEKGADLVRDLFFISEEQI